MIAIAQKPCTGRAYRVQDAGDQVHLREGQLHSVRLEPAQELLPLPAHQLRLPQGDSDRTIKAPCRCALACLPAYPTNFKSPTPSATCRCHPYRRNR